MERNLLFVGILISMVLFACDKESTTQAEQNTPISEFDLLLEKYGIFNSNVNFEGYTLGVDTNLIFFNGRDNDKLVVSAFNRIDKSNILTWKDKTVLDTIVEVEEGYGISSTHKIDQFRLIKPYKYRNDYVFVLWSIALGSEYIPGNQRIINSDLYFVSEQDFAKKESSTYPTGSLFYYSIASWFNDNILVSLNSDGGGSKLFCYSTKCQEMFVSEKSYLSPDINIIPISLYEYIEFLGDIRGSFMCRNIKTDDVKWKSEIPFLDLPEDTRLDMVNFLQEEPNYVICNFEFTLFNGEKMSQKIKLEIESGKFERL